MALFEECDEAGLHMDVFCFNALMGAVLKKDHAEKVLEVRRRSTCCCWLLLLLLCVCCCCCCRCCC